MKSEKRLIDANALINSLKEWLSASDVVGDWDVYHTIEDCICEVNAQPTIDAVEVVHGWWIPLEYDGYADGCPVWELWECSECREEHKGDEDTLTPYCPTCGAKMDGERKEKDA